MSGDAVGTGDASILRSQVAALEQLLEVYERTVLEQTSALERTTRNLSFLAEATSLLAASLDPATVLERLMKLVVPLMADWCVVDVVEDDGSIRRLPIAHADPSKAWAAEILERHPMDPTRRTPASEAFTGGRSTLIRELPEGFVDEVLTEEEHRAAGKAVGARSVAVVPLAARGRILGVVTAATAESGRLYDETDLDLLEDLTARAALAVDNARLFHEVQGAEQRYRELVEGLDAVVWEADARTGRLSFISKRVEQLLGHAPERWTTEPSFWIHVLHPDDREPTRDYRTKMVREGRNHDLEYRAIRQDGNVVWLRDVVHVVRDPQGRTLRLRGVTVDISARKLAERRADAQHAVTRVLAESESLADAAPRLLSEIGEGLDWDLGLLWVPDDPDDVLLCLDAWQVSPARTSAFVAASRGMRFTVGHGLPGIVRQTREPVWFADLDDTSQFPRAPHAQRVGLRSAVAFPIVAAGDVVAVMEFLTASRRLPDDELLQILGTVGSQIGQFIVRKRAEMNLRVAEVRKAAVLDTSLDAIVTMDVQGRIVEFNRAAEQIFDLARDEVLGRSLGDTIVPEQYREAHLRGIERFRATGEAPVLGKRLELTGLRADGNEFPIELTISRIDLPGPPMFTGFIRDISERKAAEAALQQSRERAAFLAEASRMLSSSLDYEATLRNLAHAAVPYLADWCFVDMLEEDGSLLRVAVAHIDEQPTAIARRLVAGVRYNPGPRSPMGTAAAMRSGRSEWTNDIPDEALLAEARGDEEYLLALRAAGLRAVMVVPLTAHGRTLGAVTFLTSTSGRTYTADDAALAEELAARAALAVDHARVYEESQHISRVLQESLLPPTLPAIAGIQLGARYRAAGEQNQVGGDFYDLFHTGVASWAVAVGDVCGKGADAAALTALARYTVRAAAMQTQTPSAILEMLNEAILRQRSDGRFCTLALGMLEPGPDVVRAVISSGGHPAPYIVRADGTVEQVRADGTLIGIFSDPEFTDVTVELRREDALVMFTDGVTEARRGNEFFGGAPLEQVLANCRGKHAETIAEEIEQQALAFQGGETRDDIAVLVLRVDGDR